ncbi:MAG: asparagine synthase (glutamine-hydrolyzing) [Candidatus Hydrogenedentota bacterium]
MCGILGGYNYRDSYSFKDLEFLLKRGPDFIGTWYTDKIFMAVSRLSIIDPGFRGNQPLENKRYVIAYNGEVYNFMDIKKDLINRGIIFKTSSDTEVVLEAVTEYGLNAVKRFRGFWAFVLYDKKKKKIILCRDHFGVKPLYYYYEKNKLCFSSMIKTIIQSCEIDKVLNYSALSEYVKYQLTFDNKTFIRNIFKVRPGEFVIYDIRKNRIKFQRYFDYNELLKSGHEPSLLKMRKLLYKVVNESTISDVPITTFVSGGIDSSTITAIVKPEVAYHCNFSFQDCNETKFAKSLVNYIKSTRLMTLNADEKFSLISRLNDILQDFDELSIGSVILPLNDILSLVSKRYRVILNGIGGDELFLGYMRYPMAMGFCPDPKYLPTFRKIECSLSIVERFEMLHTKGDARFYNFYDDKTVFSFYDEFNRYNTDDLRKMQIFDMRNFLPGLLNIEDKIAARHSIESRPSLLNQEFVRNVFLIPAKKLYRRNNLKHYLKKMVNDLLPQDILGRKDKMGFTTPVGTFINNSVNEIREQIYYSKFRHLYNLNKINFTVENNYSREVFGLLMLDLWLNNYISTQKA